MLRTHFSACELWDRFSECTSTSYTWWVEFVIRIPVKQLGKWSEDDRTVCFVRCTDNVHRLSCGVCAFHESDIVIVERLLQCLEIVL